MPKTLEETPAEKKASRRRGPLVILLILGATLACYIPAMRAGQIWDDNALLTQSDAVKSADGLYRIWCTTESVDYYPLTWSTFWLEWRVWGDSLWGYHLTNILMHALAAVLLWRVLAALGLPGAWLAALVFAVHPINVASVAWISELKNTLSMVLYLASIVAYLRYDQDRSRRFYLLSLALFAGALLSKASIVILPAVLVLCLWWRRRPRASDAPAGSARPLFFVRAADAWRLAPFFLMAIVMAGSAVYFQAHHAIQDEVVRTDGPLSRALLAGWSIWFYLGKILLPQNLSMIYPRWEVVGPIALAAIPLLLAVLMGVVFWLARKSWGRGPWAAYCYFLMGILPVLGGVNLYFFLYSYVADHWVYVAMPGIVALVVCGLAWVSRQRPILRKPMAAAGVAAVVMLGTLTWLHAETFQNEKTLWQDTLQKNPRAWVAKYNLGVIARQEGRPAEAISYYRAALQIRPQSVAARCNLGATLASVGDFNAAIEQYEMVLKDHPRDAIAHHDFADALAKLNRPQEALVHSLEAVRLNGRNGEAQNLCGLLLLAMDKPQAATDHLAEAVRLSPRNAQWRINLGNGWARSGRMDLAAAQFRAAIEMDPHSAFAHNNLAFALARLGLYEEAAEHYRRSLKIMPDNEVAKANLAALQEQLSREKRKPRTRPANG